MPERIELNLVDGSVQIKPGQYLGNSWAVYLAACRKVGTSYRASEKANFCSLETVPILIESLRSSGFEPVMSRDLEDELQDLMMAVQGQIGEARGRIGIVEEALKARGLALYGFQKTGVEWMAPRSCALLGDEPGLGKTIQALISLPVKAPVIVVCPAVVKGSWANEIRKWRPDLVPLIMKGKGSFRWPLAGEVVITNYDILPKDLSNIKTGAEDFFTGSTDCIPGTVIIGDESHALKSPKTLRTQRFSAICKAVWKRGGKAWGLTGTPLLNRPQELWNILHVFGLAEEAFGGFVGFMIAFGGYKDGYGISWGKPKPHVVTLLRKVMLARRREEVLPDLPVKTWQTQLVEIDQKTKDICSEALSAAEEAGVDLDGAISAASGRSVMPGFESMSRVRAALATSKIPALIDLVVVHEEEGDPIVVFSDHRAPVDTLATRPGWASITGDVDPAERSRLVDEFQAGLLKGLAVTIPAGGIGITLTRAHQAIFVDMNWTPALNKQAEDRLCRIGQTRGVIITRLVADHVLDDRMTELLAEKQAIIEASVDKSRTGNEGAESLQDQLNRAENVPITPKTPSNPALAAVSEPISSPDTPKSTTGNPGGFGWGKREAQNDLEKWAGKGIILLAGLDPDRARAANGIGFSRFDQDFGHSLAGQFQGSGRLTEKQWGAAIRLASKYQRQIGEPPAVSDGMGASK